MPECMLERTWSTDADRKRRFHRAENIHQIPPSDHDFQPIYGRRSDVESTNRGIDDDLYLRRAGSPGWRNQLFEFICHAMLINALTGHRYVRDTLEEPIAA
jgi:hypothetical protein